VVLLNLHAHVFYAVQKVSGWWGEFFIYTVNICIFALLHVAVFCW